MDYTSLTMLCIEKFTKARFLHGHLQKSNHHVNHMGALPLSTSPKKRIEQFHLARRLSRKYCKNALSSLNAYNDMRCNEIATQGYAISRKAEQCNDPNTRIKNHSLSTPDGEPFARECSIPIIDSQSIKIDVFECFKDHKQPSSPHTHLRNFQESTSTNNGDFNNIKPQSKCNV